jgi:hypothetical protein
MRRNDMAKRLKGKKLEKKAPLSVTRGGGRG